MNQGMRVLLGPLDLNSANALISGHNHTDILHLQSSSLSYYLNTFLIIILESKKDKLLTKLKHTLPAQKTWDLWNQHTHLSVMTAVCHLFYQFLS